MTIESESVSGAILRAPKRLRRRRRLVVGAAVAAVGLSIAGLFAVRFVKSPAQAAAEKAAPPASFTSATVELRVLRSMILARGLVASAAQTSITPQASTVGAASLVVTGESIAVSGQVSAGQVVLEVAGRPMIALFGALPSYRDLKPGDSGGDVRQLQDALSALNLYDGRDRSGYFGQATKIAIQRLYTKVGYDTPTTGGINDRGDASALQGAQTAVDTAERAVKDMKLQIAGGTATAGDNKSGGVEPPTMQLRYLEKALSDARAAQADLIAHTGPMMPAAESAFVPAFPAQVLRLGSKVGEVVRSPMIVLGSGALGVKVRMTSDQGALVRIGMKVTLNSESMGLSAHASVSGVGKITVDPTTNDASQTAQADSGQAGTPYIPVDVVPDMPLSDDWANADVRVTIEQSSTADKVLVVPLSAIFSSADGTTSVQRLQSNGTSTKTVMVKPGASGDGFVAVVSVVPGGLMEGDKVVVSAQTAAGG